MKYTLSGVFASLLLSSCLHAQTCEQPKALMALATSKTYFCESTEFVEIDNRSDLEPGNTGCIDYMTLDWGDGVIDTLKANDFANKKHAYFFPDSIACLLPTSGKRFVIELRVFFFNDRNNGATQEVFVIPRPRAFCSATPAALCLDPAGKVRFRGSQSCHEKKYLWDFGDGGTSTLADPEHDYKTPGNYTVRLIVENDCGKDTCFTGISAQSAVASSGTIDDMDICVPDTVTLSTTVLANAYEWIITPFPANGVMFVQGFTKNSKETKVIFKTPGTYRVELKVTGACNEDRKLIGNIEVRQGPSVSLNGIPASGCLPNFTMNPVANVSSGGNSGTVAYQWSFPGGSPTSSAVRNPAVTYSNAGLWPIALIVSSVCGDQTLRDTVNVQGEATVAVALSGIPANGCGPFTVSLSNTSTGAAGFLWRVTPSIGWQFEAGFDKNSVNPQIRFTQAGNYTIKLDLLQAPCGANKSWTGTVAVKGPPTGTLAGIPKDGGCLPDFQLKPNVNITNNGNGNTLTYSWEAPGGSPATFNQAEPTITYAAAGVFPLKVTISNGECGALTLMDSVNVRVAAKPVVSFTGVPANQCGPYTVIFTNQSEGAGKYIWRITPQSGAVFEQGFDENSVNPRIRFTQGGNYTVELELLEAPCGNDKTWKQNFTVKTPPVAQLAPQSDQCVPIGIKPVLSQFDNGNDAAIQYEWLAPGSDKPVQNTLDPGTLQYANAGTYTVTFIAQNGCASDTTSVSFTLSPPQALSFQAYPDSVCAGTSPIPIVPNVQGGNWQGNVAANSFDVKKAVSGWNPFSYTVNPGTSCESKLDGRIFVVALEVKAGADRSVCDTLGTALLGSGQNNGVWRGPGLLDSVSGLVSLPVLGLGTEIFRYRVTISQLGCVFSDSLTLTVLPKPFAQPAVPGKGCINLPVQYTGNPAGMSRYFWNLGNGQTSTQKDPASVFSSVGLFGGLLVVENSARCSDTTNFSIQIVAPPVLQISLSRKKICGPDTIFISGANTQGDNVAFSWKLGNGDSSRVAVPGPVLYQPGLEDTLYFITLSAGNVCPVRSVTDTILVQPPPGIRLTAETDTVCSGAKQAFSVLLTGKPTEYWFDSGNGIKVNTLPIPDVRYYADTGFVRYRAIFWAKNQCAERYDTAFVLASPPLARAFPNFSKETLCAGELLYVQNGATPFGVRVRYVFDDGFTTEDPNPVHAFAAPGRHAIIQYATTGCGFDSIVRYVNVLPPPPADFKMPDYTCAGVGLPLAPTVDTIGRTFRWFWPGDSSRVLRPAPVFPQAGNYPITLRVEDILTRCTAEITKPALVRANPTATFMPSDTTACGMLTTTLTPAIAENRLHQWTASNGELAVGPNPTFIFRDSGLYSIRYTATDLFGCKDDTLLWKFRVWPVPIVNFAMDKTFSCEVPATVRLSPFTIGATGFQWFFPDGTSTQENNPEKTFSAEGNYAIKLTASNQFLCSATAEKTFRALLPPVAEAGVTDPSQCVNESIGIENTSQNADRFFWRIGPFTSTDTVPKVVFQTPGTYDLFLIARRDSLCADSFFLRGVITVHPAPEAGFTVIDSMPLGHSKGLIFIFSKAKGATQYWYDLDGDTSTLANPVINYGRNGTKMITQIVTNAFGCADTASRSVEVTPFGTLFVPDAFAPGIDNTTGEYNFFIPKGKGIEQYQIRVYSPYGHLVWSSGDLTDGRITARWDGRVADGDLCAQGVYAWIIEGAFEAKATHPESLGQGPSRFSVAGTVTVIR